MTQEFIMNVWPSEMQRAMLGQISSEEMLNIVDELYNK